MNSLGSYALFVALGLALWGMVAALAGYRTADLRFLRSAFRALYGILGLVLFSTILLLLALFRNDFTLKYVWEYSRRSQPLVYKLAALWGGMNGSLLFWCLLLALFSVLAVTFNRRNNLKILPFTSFLLLLTLSFFLILIFFKANPFEPLRDATGVLVSSYSPGALAMIDGNGLNPLLQNFYMAIHPPMLYFGYVGFAIPFALMLGSLAHKEHNTLWMSSVRNWALFSWLTLGVGVLLGAYWAYIELGWGGYWAWDPVENASFLPWITATAFLHSYLMQEKRGIYRFWNVCFIVVTFLLSIYGTYLTRSGILQSVHAFGQENSSVPWIFRLGTIFLLFLGGMFLLSAYLIFRRRKLLRNDQRLESAGSKESLFLYANLLFTLFTVVIFFGVTSPIFYRMWTHEKLSRGPGFYNPRVIPIALLILLVMAIASIAPWRKGGWASYRKRLGLPLIAAFSSLTASIIAFFSGGASARADFASRPLTYFYLLACVVLSFFAATIFIDEYFRTTKHLRQSRKLGLISSFTTAFRSNPRRYGGYVVHIGIVCLMLGIAFSSAFKMRYEKVMTPGDSATFGPYTVRLVSLDHDNLNANLKKVNQIRIWAKLQVFKGGVPICTLRPERVYYAGNPKQPSYEVAIHSTLMRDFYTLMAGFDLEKGTAVIGVFITPMVAWIWLGGIFILLGGLAALIPLEKP